MRTTLRPDLARAADDVFVAGELRGADGATSADSKALTVHAGQHVLVAMHHHPLPMRSTWLDGVALRDATDFWQIIDAHPHVRGVVCGHVHQAFDQERNGLRFMSTPSTCAQFLPRSDFFALDDRPPGMRWLELYADGHIETEVAWAPKAG